MGNHLNIFERSQFCSQTMDFEKFAILSLRFETCEMGLKYIYCLGVWL